MKQILSFVVSTYGARHLWGPNFLRCRAKIICSNWCTWKRGSLILFLFQADLVWLDPWDLVHEEFHLQVLHMTLCSWYNRIWMMNKMTRLMHTPMLLKSVLLFSCKGLRPSDYKWGICLTSLSIDQKKNLIYDCVNKDWFQVGLGGSCPLWHHLLPPELSRYWSYSILCF